MSAANIDILHLLESNTAAGLAREPSNDGTITALSLGGLRASVRLDELRIAAGTPYGITIPYGQDNDLPASCTVISDREPALVEWRILVSEEDAGPLRSILLIALDRVAARDAAACGVSVEVDEADLWRRWLDSPGTAMPIQPFIVLLHGQRLPGGPIGRNGALVATRHGVAAYTFGSCPPWMADIVRSIDETDRTPQT